MYIWKIEKVEFYAAYFAKLHALIFTPKKIENSKINADQVDNKKKTHFQR